MPFLDFIEADAQIYLDAVDSQTWYRSTWCENESKTITFVIATEGKPIKEMK